MAHLEGRRPPPRGRRSGRLLGPALLAVALSAGPAAASTFDDDGRLHLDDAAFALPLDSAAFPDGFDLTVYNASYSPMPVQQVLGRFERDEAGLEGEGAFRFGGEAIYASLSLGGLPTDLEGHRVEYVVWQLPEGTRASLDLYVYGGEDVPGALQSGNYDDLFFVGHLPFRPTGRVTSDGWEEWSTGPVDFDAPGGARASVITLFDQQLKALQQSYWAGYDASVSVRLDAFEVRDLGPRQVPPVACRLLDEDEVCGEAGLCLYGRCVDAALVAGQVPNDLARDEYVRRRLFELKTFSGGRLPLARMAALEDELLPLIDDPAPARFWPTLQAAVSDLRDGHASAPFPAYPASAFVGVCAHLGEADLLPEPEVLPLVFEAPGTSPLAVALQPGDALVAIDGLPPAEWARVARRLVRHPGDPEAFDVVTAPDLLGAAAVAGSLVEVARCPRDGSAPDPLAPCAEEELVRLEFDLAALLGEPLWDGRPPEWRNEALTCDYRFERPVDDPQATESDFAGFSDDADGIRALLINAVPALYSEEGQAWGQTVRSALQAAPSRVLLDQRLGHGGSVDAVDLLAGLLVAEEDFARMELLPSFERPFTEDVFARLSACHAEGEDLSGCGNSFPWVLGDTIPDRGAGHQTRLAVLIGSDVSGNDFTSKLLSFRQDETRIFGAAPTWGAFGVIWTLPPWIEELHGGSFQVHDTKFLTSSDDVMAATFTTGTGVPPDVVVRQTQSDALRNQDTVLEAARAWLRGE